MSHDCRVSGSLALKPGVQKDQVRAALAEFFDHIGADFDAESAADGVVLGTTRGNESISTLLLDIKFSGYTDEDLVECLEPLAEIIDGGQALILEDFDTGDSEMARVPVFLGSPVEKKVAALQYGLGEMSSWLKPLIGSHAFDRVVGFISEQPLVLDDHKPSSPALGQ